MTQTEKDMQELNMTPEKLAARQEQLAGITGAPRKTRSDAGKPREKKAPAVEGKLSQEQVIKLEALFAEREEAKITTSGRAAGVHRLPRRNHGQVAQILLECEGLRAS